MQFTSYRFYCLPLYHILFIFYLKYGFYRRECSPSGVIINLLKLCALLKCRQFSITPQFNQHICVLHVAMRISTRRTVYESSSTASESSSSTPFTDLIVNVFWHRSVFASDLSVTFCPVETAEHPVRMTSDVVAFDSPNTSISRYSES